MYRRSFLKFLGLTSAVVPFAGAEMQLNMLGIQKGNIKPEKLKSMKIDHHRSTPGLTMCESVTESGKDSWGMDIRNRRR